MNARQGWAWGVRLAGGWLAAWLVWAAEETPFDRIRTYTEGQSTTNLVAVEELVRRAAADPAEAAAAERQLLALLESSATVDAKRFVCRQLRMVGSDVCAPALGRLLKDPELSHAARGVLETMASPVAGGTLRMGLLTAQGETLVGIINSLGERADVGSVAALGQQFKSRDLQVVQAAIVALGKIGGDPSVETLRTVMALYDPTAAARVATPAPLSEEIRFRLDTTLLADAFLRCAERFAAEGRNADAAGLYRWLMDSPPVAQPARSAALRGLVALDPDQATPTVIGRLRTGDAADLEAVQIWVRTVPMASLEAVLPLLEVLAPAQQLPVVHALGERGEPALGPILMKLTHSSEAPVRAAALEGLGRQANPDLYLFLVDRLEQATTLEERAAALRSVVATARKLPDVEARPQPVIAAMNRAKGAAKAGLVACLGELGGAAALRRVVEAARDPDAVVQEQALAALAAWPDTSALEELMVLARGTDDAARHARLVRGCLRLIGQPSARAPAQTVELLRQTLELAATPEEKRWVLDAVTALPTVEALGLAERLADEAGLGDDAGRAVVRLARELRSTAKADARAALERMLNRKVDPSVLAEAREALAQTGP